MPQRTILGKTPRAAGTSPNGLARAQKEGRVAVESRETVKLFV